MSGSNGFLRAWWTPNSESFVSLLIVFCVFYAFAGWNAFRICSHGEGVLTGIWSVESWFYIFNGCFRVRSEVANISCWGHMMEQRFQFFENRLALLEGRINTLENEKVSLLGKVNQQAVLHSFERHQFTQLMKHDGLIWALYTIDETWCFDLGTIFCQNYMRWSSDGGAPTFQAKQKQKASRDGVVFWQK